MSQVDFPADGWEAWTSEARVEAARAYVDDVLTAALMINYEGPRMDDRIWSASAEANLILQQAPIDWVTLVEDATVRAGRFAVLLECIAQLLDEGRALPPVLREWQAKVNRGEILKPRQRGPREGSRLVRHYWLAILVNDVARIAGISPTRSETKQPCSLNECPLVDAQASTRVDAKASTKKKEPCQPGSACDLVSCVIWKEKHQISGLKRRNSFATLAKIHGAFFPRSR